MKRIGLVLVLLACSDVSGPPIVIEGRQPYPVNAMLVAIWQKTEECSGLHRDISTARFYTATDIRYGDGFARGLWSPEGDQIIVLITETQNAVLWEHEIMHDLLRLNGHPAEFFNGRCGNLM